MFFVFAVGRLVGSGRLVGWWNQQYKLSGEDRDIWKAAEVWGVGSSRWEGAFTNIFDCEYRCNLMAWQADRQEVHQLTFARSDRRCTVMETLIAASIAANRL